MTENRNGKVKQCVTKPPSPSKQGAMTQPALINNYLHVKAPNRALADCNFSKFYGKFGVVISWLLFHMHMECWLVLTSNIQILIDFEKIKVSKWAGFTPLFLGTL